MIDPNFQLAVGDWLAQAFPMNYRDPRVRAQRFLEESLELCQAVGMTPQIAHNIVHYVFNRPVGDTQQEVGGVMITLAGLCFAQNLDARACAEAELLRCWNNIQAIQMKSAGKPTW